jgi:hypothetical protein
VTLAYCPTFDFNPEETKMKLEEIKTILEDKGLTLNQKAANLEAAILKASTPSALNIKPAKERAKRGPNKAKEPKSPLSDAFANGADHEAH